MMNDKVKELVEKCLPPNPHCFHQSDCPVVIEAVVKATSIIRKAVEKEFVEWGNEFCTEHSTKTGRIRRHRCFKCWQSLQQQAVLAPEVKE